MHKTYNGSPENVIVLENSSGTLVGSVTCGLEGERHGNHVVNRLDGAGRYVRMGAVYMNGPHLQGVVARQGSRAAQYALEERDVDNLML
jgi:hypothetical protein